MPQAPNHEMVITKLEGSRFANKVHCNGCNFQAHCLPEEDPSAVVAQHQKRWGYKPKGPVVVKPAPAVVATPTSTTVTNTPKLVVKK